MASFPSYAWTLSRLGSYSLPQKPGLGEKLRERERGLAFWGAKGDVLCVGGGPTQNEIQMQVISLRPEKNNSFLAEKGSSTHQRPGAGKTSALLTASS